MYYFILGELMEKEKALKNLQILMENIKELQKSNYEKTNPTLDKFKNRAERYFKDIFGIINKYDKDFKKIRFFSLSSSYNLLGGVPRDYNEDNKEYHNGLIKAQTIIESAIEEVEEWEDSIEDNITLVKTIKINNSNKVFIVHGHDNGAKQEIARFLEKLGLEPIILHEQVSGQKTIIEKIEEYAGQVGFGIVLYTACDVGGRDKDSLQSRARQNVVFEHGYLIGLLGRNRVCPLVKGKVETPGDIRGVVYTTMDDNGSWHLPLARELKAAGYNIDSSKLL
jgi:predicted nucleotide-binding protein